MRYCKLLLRNSVCMSWGEISKCFFFRRSLFISLNCQTFFPPEWIGNNHISSQWVQPGTLDQSLTGKPENVQDFCTPLEGYHSVNTNMNLPLEVSQKASHHTPTHSCFGRNGLCSSDIGSDKAQTQHMYSVSGQHVSFTNHRHSKTTLGHSVSSLFP